MLAACAGSAEAPLGRTLPGPPAYLAEAQVAPPAPGEACLTVAGRERAGRLKANQVIRAVKGDWSALQAAYAKGR